MTFIEDEHPRDAGKFIDKSQNTPEVSLTSGNSVRSADEIGESIVRPLWRTLERDGADAGWVLRIAQAAARAAQAPADFKPDVEKDFHRDQWKAIEGGEQFSIQINSIGDDGDSESEQETEYFYITRDQARSVLAMLSGEASD